MIIMRKFKNVRHFFELLFHISEIPFFFFAFFHTLNAFFIDFIGLIIQTLIIIIP